MLTKQCKVCEVVKPISEYHKAPGYSGGYKPQCKVCYLAYQKEKRLQISPETRRNYWVKHKYGISLDEQHAMLQAQGGVCAICKQPMARLCVDHDHSNGAVRGLLCVPCNTGLGSFKDDKVILANALDYLSGRHHNHF